MKLTICAVGRLKAGPECDLLEKYRRRLSWPLEIVELEDVYLYTVDDLQGVIRENLKSRRQAARQAEQIIEAEVARFAMAQRSVA